MILGIGIDLIEMERIKKACVKEAFLIRYFTLKERQLIHDHIEKAAGNFAVKEAVVKVFGTGFGKIEPKDIEVLRNEKGAPVIKLYGAAEKEAKAMGIERLHVSITNTESYAAAYVVGEGGKKGEADEIYC